MADEIVRAKVIAVGDAGVYALRNVIDGNIPDIQYATVNTHPNGPKEDRAAHVMIGPTTLHGLGTGGMPEQGKRAAEESESAIEEMLYKLTTVFIVSGLGGGTGSGASPVIARIAREMNIETTSVVTTPPQFEGSRKHDIAVQSAELLNSFVNKLIICPMSKIIFRKPIPSQAPSLNEIHSLAARTMAWQVLARLSWEETDTQWI